MSAGLWIAAAIAGALGTAACYWAMWRAKGGVPALRALDADFQCLDMLFRYTPEQAFASFDKAGPQGKGLLRRFWLTDFGFIASFGLVMLVVTHNTGVLAPLRHAMYALACLRGAADTLENLLLLRALGAYPQRRLTGTLKAASAATTLKWLLMGLWVAGLFINLVYRAALL